MQLTRNRPPIQEPAVHRLSRAIPLVLALTALNIVITG